MDKRFERGDQVTVIPRPGDPYALRYHRHVLVADVDNRGYWVRHGGMPGRYGPYREDELVEGWTRTDT